ncbi:hypothetical protein M2390_000310 [Mycetocola sp. BIGb0189]|uniref:hypothetical protein n=1 Tax=Mycetocola sp. BIGb0189 TaxID=2940604 RepID=UPI002167671A|nr:hypothetical protein [Mycetocola sp. BIGb0189]MCS4275152.1 hypothetical protein [Mycetocola sp. BIGb0189]
MSVVSDLPVFIDPFLLFHSEKPEYQALHESIVNYLVFLRDKAHPDLDPAIIKNLYAFKEVKQNWLGFTVLGNGGSGLGPKFARSLHKALGSILSNFGDESITRSPHLEKLALISQGVGRDNISDFTTNLIKGYLLEYTQAFAKKYLKPEDCGDFPVTRAEFDYVTEVWKTRRYYLPKLGDDFVLLTPFDLLTSEETWINHSDMVKNFTRLPEAISDEQMRGQINMYFRSRLGQKPTAKDYANAAQDTIWEFPELVDHYIRIQEDSGEDAEAISSEKRQDVYAALVDQVKQAIPDIEQRSSLYEMPLGSYDEALVRVNAFKDYIENNDGYRLINRNGQPFSRESEVQIFFGLIWYRTEFDVNREVNNGRGPVDFKVSKGSLDKSLIEFKLASNSALKRNLENQVAIYEKANGVKRSVKAIICYTAEHHTKVVHTLNELGLSNDESIVVIDARSDNKPSASKA